MGGARDGRSSLALQFHTGKESCNPQPITCQEVQEWESQLREYLAQFEEARGKVAEAITRKGAGTEVVCRQASRKYCQASKRLVELQEEVKEIVDSSQTI